MGWWLSVAPIAGTVVVEVGAAEVVGRVDVAGLVEPVDVVPPGSPVVPGDETVVGLVVEVDDVLPTSVVGTLEGLVGATTGTVTGGTSARVVPVVLGSPGEVVTVVVEDGVVPEELVVAPVVVVDGVVVAVVEGTDVTDVTDVTDGSDVAVGGDELVVVVVGVVVGGVPAASASAGTPMKPAVMRRAKIVPRDPAARRVNPLVEISEEKGIPGTHVRKVGRPAQPAGKRDHSARAEAHSSGTGTCVPILRQDRREPEARFQRPLVAGTLRWSGTTEPRRARKPGRRHDNLA